MGGAMTWSRFRQRNALVPRKPLDDPDPYWRDDSVTFYANADRRIIVGDLNRMERDYTVSEYADDLLAEIQAATGVDVEDARKVLTFVFLAASPSGGEPR